VEGVITNGRPGHPQARTPSLSLAFPLGAVIFYVGLLATAVLTLLIDLKSEAGIALAALVLVGSFPLALMLDRLFQRKLESGDASQVAEAGRWLGMLSWLAFVLALPLVANAIFFTVSMMSERGGWNPAVAEAVIVPLSFLGAVLLPLAGIRLRRAARPGDFTPASEAPTRVQSGTWPANLVSQFDHYHRQLGRVTVGTICAAFVLLGLMFLAAKLGLPDAVTSLKGVMVPVASIAAILFIVLLGATLASAGVRLLDGRMGCAGCLVLVIAAGVVMAILVVLSIGAYYPMRRPTAEGAVSRPFELKRDARASRTFELRFVMKDKAADWVRKIVHAEAPVGIVGIESNSNSITVSAAPPEMARVLTCLAALESPDLLFRGSKPAEPFAIYDAGRFEPYVADTAMRTARSFFLACAMQDHAAVARLLDVRILAALRSEDDAKRAAQLHAQASLTPEEIKTLRDNPNSTVSEYPGPEWNILTKSLYDDWPGKQEKLKRLVDSWNRYGLLMVQSGRKPAPEPVRGPAEYLEVKFENAPKSSYQITITPAPFRRLGGQAHFFTSLPPWDAGMIEDLSRLKQQGASVVLPPPTSPGNAPQPAAANLVPLAVVSPADVEKARAQLEWAKQLKDTPAKALNVLQAEEDLRCAEAQLAGDPVAALTARRDGIEKRLEQLKVMSQAGIVVENLDQVVRQLAETEAALARLKSAAPPSPPMKSETGGKVSPTMRTTSIAGTMKAEDLKALSWHQFDQTPGKYWRELADARRFREAAELIEQYLALHPELEQGLQKINGANLHFHAAQCRALDGDKEGALAHLALSKHDSPSSVGLLWNDYVAGTEAFLRGDRDALTAAHLKLAQGGEINQTNTAVIEQLIANFGKDYAEAYGIKGEKP
jgi:hypothetical protein